MNLIKFERQKIGDMRQILQDFTLIQLKDSVKSMEILTAMYNDIAAIDADKDIEVRKFCLILKGHFLIWIRFDVENFQILM